jgi:hypothetical protein
MTFYRRTMGDRAAAILSHGFEDATGSYGTDFEYSGVWLSDRPLDCNDAGFSPAVNVLLEIELDLPEAEIADYEWIEEDKGYREWLVPASILNRMARVRIVPE